MNPELPNVTLDLPTEEYADQYVPLKDEHQLVETYRWQDGLKTALSRAALVGAILLSPTSTHTTEADNAPIGLLADTTPSCYGDYCSGQDAEITGCAKDAITIAAAEIKENDKGGISVEVIDRVSVDVPIPTGGEGVLELRYSKECQTTWARLKTTQGSSIGFVDNIDEVGIKKDDGYTEKRVIAGYITGSPPAVSRSPMIYGPDREFQAYVKISGATTLPYETGTDWTKIGHK